MAKIDGAGGFTAAEETYFLLSYMEGSGAYYPQAGLVTVSTIESGGKRDVAGSILMNGLVNKITGSVSKNGERLGLIFVDHNLNRRYILEKDDGKKRSVEGMYNGYHTNYEGVYRGMQHATVFLERVSDNDPYFKELKIKRKNSIK